MEVKEITACYLKKVSDNSKSNRETIENYGKMIAMAVLAKEPRHSIDRIRERKKRMEYCNSFWLTETYETSKVKRLLQTYLCHDRFCSNCANIRQYVMKSRFLPLMEQYRNSLYHMVLTVPDCSGGELRAVIYRMGRCFKTLVNHMNGNRKIKGLVFSGYGYQGCIRSLEIDCKGENIYHPHFHVAVVFDSFSVDEDKHIFNQFSQNGKRLFSEFEITLQRIWWLLINRQRLTSEFIFGENDGSDIYSCFVKKFHPDDYPKLLGYITKKLSCKNGTMNYLDFKALYSALNGVRQIQGYGIFYNMAERDMEYTEQEYTLLADYIAFGEQPTISHEPLSRLAGDTPYTILKKQYRY